MSNSDYQYNCEQSVQPGVLAKVSKTGLYTTEEPYDLSQPYSEYDVTLQKLTQQRKPQEFYNLLAKVFKLEELSCVELFSRRPKDWIFDVWGNEVPGRFQRAEKYLQGNLLVYKCANGVERKLQEVPYKELTQGEDTDIEGHRQNIVLLDGFTSMETNALNAGLEDLDLEAKYGHYAHESWIDRTLGLRKMSLIKTEVQGDFSLEARIRAALAPRIKILAISKEELNEAWVEPFKIDLVSAEPVFEKPLRYNPTLTRFIDDEIEQLLERGLIYRADTDWAAKVILAPKGDSWRMCLNYVGINAKTRADKFPLPNIEDIYTWLGGKKIFSKIDLLSGYWQVPVEKNSQKYTGFITPRGLYCFKILPFGLRNAPSHFQRILNGILQPLLGICCLVYIDDIIIFSESPEQHLVDIGRVLDLLEKVNFQINLCKSIFFCKQVTFLGMKVQEGHISVDNEKIRKIIELSAPRTIRQLRGFLGMASYYRKYIQGFAKLAAPLYDLTKEKTEYRWGARQQQAFTKIKELLAQEPILALPNASDPFLLAVDFSYEGMGLVFSQLQQGEEKVIGYYSKTLTPQERRYGSTEGECATILWALSKVRQYVIGTKFFVQTDHRALLWLLRTKQQKPKLSRWASLLSQYDFTLVYRPGEKHANADFLSRSQDLGGHVQMITPRTKKNGGSDGSNVNYVMQETLNDRPCSECALDDNPSQQMVCDGCSLVFHNYCLGLSEIPDLYWYCAVCQKRISDHGPEDVTEDLPQLRQIQQDSIAGTAKGHYWANDKLYIFKGKRYLEYPPRALRVLLLEEFHFDNAHIGCEKLAYKLEQEYYWKNLKEDAREYCAKCFACQLQSVRFRQPANLKAMYLGNRPRQIYSLDLVPDILPKSFGGKNQIIVAVDNFSKYVILGSLEDRQSGTLATWFYQNIICIYGTPDLIRTDNGSEFKATFEEMCHNLSIRHHTTLPYHPQGNGLAERFVRTTKTYLIRSLIGNEVEEWDEYLPQIAFAINTSVAASTGLTPFEIQFGTAPGSRVDLRNEPYVLEAGDEQEYHQHISQYLQQLFSTVYRKVKNYQDIMRNRYVKSRQQDQPLYKFNVGMPVVLRNFYKTRLGAKSVGPYIICHLQERSAKIYPIGNRSVERWYNLKDLAPLRLDDFQEVK